MALTEILNGELADAEVVNANFNYLDERIDNTAASITTNNTMLLSQISTLSSNTTSSLNTLDTRVTSEVNSIKTNIISANGLYITTSFNTSTGDWYREYFSNESKTTRVFLEQGGTYLSDSVTNKSAKNNYELILPKTFTNDLFYFNRSVQIVADTGDLSNRYVMYNKKEYKYITGREAEGKLSVVTLDITTYAASHFFTWYACGV